MFNLTITNLLIFTMFPEDIRYNIFKYTIWVRWFFVMGIMPLLLIIIYLAPSFPDVFKADKIAKLLVSSVSLTIFLFLYNSLFILFEKARKNKKEIKNKVLKILFYLIYYFIFDIIAAVWLVFNSGGSSSILLVSFFLIILFASVTHTSKVITNIGIFSFILINIMFFLDQSGIFPAIDFFYSDKGFSFPGIFMGLATFSFDVAYGSSIFIAIAISKVISEKEATLIKERDKFESLIENLKDGIVVLDRENYITFMNKVSEEIFGVKRKDVLNKQASFSLLEDYKLKNFIKALLIKQTDKAKPIEMQLTEPRPAFAQIYSIDISNSTNTTAVMKVIRDISREKEIEKMKSEFIFIAAHQLRTPLSAIKWVFSMILDGDVGKITNEQKEILEKGKFSTQRMIILVNDLLNISRIEEGKFNYNFENINLEDIIKKVLAMEDNKIKEKEINLTFKKESTASVVVNGDSEKLYLALQNIIENAINYTFKKGSVEILIKETDGNFKIEVKDTGAGIPKADLNRLFNKFYRGSNVIRMQTEGTGLGLFITKNIIDRHNGKIEIDSKEGEGTKVSIFIPKLQNKL